MGSQRSKWEDGTAAPGKLHLAEANRLGAQALPGESLRDSKALWPQDRVEPDFPVLSAACLPRLGFYSSLPLAIQPPARDGVSLS